MRNKLLASAQKHMDKGNLTRAIKDFNKLLEIQPDDVRVRLRIGDLQARLGKKREAVETYEQVAEDYFYQGFYLKSVAVLKQILRLDPARTDIQVRLAELYQQLNLLSDSMAQYRSVAAVFKDRGDYDKYIEVLFRIAELDPEDINVYIIIAEQLSALDRREEAADAFAVAADRLREAGRINEFIKVAERYIFHRSDDLHRLKELVAAYLDRQDPKRALAKLQLLFKVAPKDSEGLELLVEAFLAIDKPAKATRVLKELADLYTSQGQEELAIEAYRRVLDIDPDDPDAQGFLGLTGHHDAIELEPVSSDLPHVPGPVMGGPALPAREAPITAMGAQPQPGAANMQVGMAPDLGGLATHGDQASMQQQLLASQTMVHPSITGAIPIDIEPLEEEDGVMGTWRRLEATSGIFQMPSGVVTCNKGLSVGDADSIARLLVEIDGFVKYGLYDQARSTLENVLELDPLSVSARERATRLAIERGNNEEAVEQLLALTKICWRPDQERALGYLDQAEDLAPGHEEIAYLRVELGVPDHRQSPSAGADEEMVAPSGIIELDEDEDDDLFVPFDTDEDEDDFIEEVVVGPPSRPAAFDSGPNTPLPSRAHVPVPEGSGERAGESGEPPRPGASFERAETVAGDVRSVGMAWAAGEASESPAPYSPFAGRSGEDSGWAPPYAAASDSKRVSAPEAYGEDYDEDFAAYDEDDEDSHATESVVDDSEAAILAALAGPEERRELSSGSYQAAAFGGTTADPDESDLPLYEATYSSDYEPDLPDDVLSESATTIEEPAEVEPGAATMIDPHLSRAVDVYAESSYAPDGEDDDDDLFASYDEASDDLEHLVFVDDEGAAPPAADLDRSDPERSPSLELDALTSLADSPGKRRFSLNPEDGELSPADLGVSVWEEVAKTASMPLGDIEDLGEQAASSAASGELAPPPGLFEGASGTVTIENEEFEELGIEDFEEIEELDDFEDMVIEEIAIDETGSLSNGNGAHGARRGSYGHAHDADEPEGIQFDLPPLPPGLPADLCDELNELEFYASLGLRDEMKSLLFDITSSFPEHAEWIMERVAVIEKQAGMALGV